MPRTHRARGEPRPHPSLRLRRGSRGLPRGDARRLQQFRANFRRHAYATSRLLANLGAEARTPLLEHLARPVASPAKDKRWLNGLYLDVPEEWDDPYRFFRW